MKVEDALHGAGQGVMVEKCLGLRGAEEWEVPRGGSSLVREVGSWFTVQKGQRTNNIFL